MRLLEVQQNLIVRIYLNKIDLKGDTKQNYIGFKVLPVRSLYRQCYTSQIKLMVSSLTQGHMTLMYGTQKKMLIKTLWII